MNDLIGSLRSAQGLLVCLKVSELDPLLVLEGACITSCACCGVALWLSPSCFTAHEPRVCDPCSAEVLISGRKGIVGGAL